MKRIRLLSLCTLLALGLTACGAPDPQATPSPALSPVPVLSPGEEVVTVDAGADCPLDGRLTLPEGVEQPPVVVLLHGSGPSDKNEAIGACAPFADLAEGLAQRGVATLRYDKRTFAWPKSFAKTGEVTLEQECLDDLDAALALVAADPRLKDSPVYVLGHSLGGMLVPRIAHDHPELAGVISMAGSLRPLYEIIYDQNVELVAGLRPTLPEDQQKNLDIQMALLERQLAILRSGDLSALKDGDVLMGVPVGYWKSLDACAAAKYLDTLTMPALILQGEADFQVYADKDYPLWLEAAETRPNLTCRLYPELNHLMMPTAGKRDITEYDAPAHVAPAVLDDIAAFVLAE